MNIPANLQLFKQQNPLIMAKMQKIIKFDQNQIEKIRNLMEEFDGNLEPESPDKSMEVSKDYDLVAESDDESSHKSIQ